MMYLQGTTGEFKVWLSALNKAYDYITENCVNWEYPVRLGISEGFHDNKKTKKQVYDFYQERCPFQIEYANGKPPEGKKKALTYAGRAKTLSDIARHSEPFHHKIGTSADGKILCMLDLTLTGNFVLATQHSFQDADNPENILCSVTDNLLSAIIQWNFEHPLNCKEVSFSGMYKQILDTGMYFENQATVDRLNNAKLCLECYNDIESYRKEVHRQFPALYPDDIENISDLSLKQSWLYCLHYTTLLNEKRSKESTTDTSCWCTCPTKESQN